MKSQEAGRQIVEQLTGRVNLSRFVVLANFVVNTLFHYVVQSQDLWYTVTYKDIEKMIFK